MRAYLLLGFGEETPLGRIDTRRVDAFRERMLSEGRLSRRSIQRILVLLHGILKRAKRRGWISSNPSEDVERVTFRRSGEFNVLTPTQVAALARAAVSEQDAALFTVAAYTGLRLGELRALRWGDVDFAKRLVHLRRSYTHGEAGPPKSGRVRSVPLIDQAAVPLDALSRRERYTGDEDLVFASAIGKPSGDTALRGRFYAALEAAGLGALRRKPDPFVFHDLRHTFGMLAVQAFPLSDVKAYMGHADIQTTMIYVHHVPRHDAAARLSAAVGDETGAHTADTDFGAENVASIPATRDPSPPTRRSGSPVRGERPSINARSSELPTGRDRSRPSSPSASRDSCQCPPSPSSSPPT